MGVQYAGKYGPTSGINELEEGVTEVELPSPLGINFEEKEGRGGYPGGLTVIGLVPGGNAEKSGKVAVGDDLIAVTGIKMSGAKFERQMLDCSRWDFDTVVDAIQSNNEQFNCKGVILQCAANSCPFSCREPYIAASRCRFKKAEA